MATPSFDTAIDAIARRFGFRPQLVDTGGGHMVLEGRLESGQWLWISDADSGLHPLARRAELEARGIRIGWLLQVYPDSPRGNEPDTNTVLASVVHASGTAETLGDLVEAVLSGLPDNVHLSVAADGRATTTRGVRVC